MVSCLLLGPHCLLLLLSESKNKTKATETQLELSNSISPSLYLRLGQGFQPTMNRDHISLKLPDKEKRNTEEDEFTMYVMDLSYFSGKLECYFNYQVYSLSN